MRKQKRSLYLDSDIVAKTGVFLKLILYGEDFITIKELLNFNKLFATSIVKALGYDDYFLSPLEMLASALSRFCDYNKSTNCFYVDPNRLRWMLKALEDYRNENSANRMFMSVFDNLMFEFADKVPEKQVKQVQSKLKLYIANNLNNDTTSNPLSISFSDKEIAGRMLSIYFELYFEKKLGLNFSIILPSIDDLDLQYERLLTQEKSYNRLLNNEDLPIEDLKMVARIIREKKFTIAKQSFLVRKLKTSTRQRIKKQPNKANNKEEKEIITDFLKKYEESIVETGKMLDDISKAI